MSVSVIIPSLNPRPWIEQAVQSATAQCNNVIVVDGGSTDGSLEAVWAERPDGHGVRLRADTIQEIIPGIGRARNRGVIEASTDWFVPLDADDWLAPDYIARCTQAIGPRVGVVATGIWMEPEGTIVLPDTPIRLDRLLRENRLFSCSMVRFDAWRDVGGYDQTPGCYEDWDLWIRILAAGWEIAVVPEPLYHYRVHEGSSCGKIDDLGRWQRAAYIREKHRALYAMCGI